MYERESSLPAAVGFDIFASAQERSITIWPENVRAYSVFARLATQWRAGGMGGATGLDYAAVLAVIDRLHLPDEQADELFDDIQIMEAEALAVMTEKTPGQ